MRKLPILAVTASLAALAIPAAAQASWGGGSKPCKASEEAHCYGISERYGLNFLASIDAINMTVSNIPEWWSTSAPEVRFDNREEWVSFIGLTKTWVETGLMSGTPTFGCCALHQFAQAHSPSRGWWGEWDTQTVPGYTYNYVMLFDVHINGEWGVYWGIRPGSYEWWDSGWRIKNYPVYGNIQQAGLEATNEVEPEDAGKQEVAWSNGGEWHPWTNAARRDVNCTACVNLANNPDLNAPGNMSWGTAPGANTPILREEAPEAPPITTLKIETAPAGKVLTPLMGGVPPGQATPTGKYRARLGGKEYVGNSLADAKSLPQWPHGGAQGPSLSKGATQ